MHNLFAGVPHVSLIVAKLDSEREFEREFLGVDVIGPKVADRRVVGRWVVDTRSSIVNRFDIEREFLGVILVVDIVLDIEVDHLVDFSLGSGLVDRKEADHEVEVDCPKGRGTEDLNALVSSSDDLAGFWGMVYELCIRRVGFGFFAASSLAAVAASIAAKGVVVRTGIRADIGRCTFFGGSGLRV